MADSLRSAPQPAEAPPRAGPTALPRISVVTSSYNQGRFLARTIESVLAQQYPCVEHIVVDNVSTDETPAVLARYPHLRVIREPDRGQAEAINKGFRHATGDILCFLNSDDTLLPGALQRVAREIDPARGRHVVVGRCIYTDADDRPTGEEHPCAFESHRRVLEAWKKNCLPQPAVFWSAEVWRACGPLDEAEPLVLDYDLFCRFSRRYRFHVLDQVLATYRLHDTSKSCSAGGRSVESEALRVSRRYWGPPTRPLYWRLLGSWLDHYRTRAAFFLTARGTNELQWGSRATGLVKVLGGMVLSPWTTLRRLVRRFGPAAWQCPSSEAAALGAWLGEPLAPQTLKWLCFAAVHGDKCVGPTVRFRFTVKPEHRELCLDGAPVLRFAPTLAPREIDLFLDGRPVGRHRVGDDPSFRLKVGVDGLAPGRHELKLVSRCFVVPHDYLGNGDMRPLSFRLHWAGLFPSSTGPLDPLEWEDRAVALP